MTVSVFVCLHLCFFVLFCAFCYNSQNFLKNLFKINTLPFLTMLCLFSVFDFGNWEILKNQGVISFLVVAWLQFPKIWKRWAGLHTQKMQRAKDARAKNAADANAGRNRQKRLGNWEMYLYLYYFYYY